VGELNEPVVDVEVTLDAERPRTRADCRLGVGVRPCPYVGCKWHLADPRVTEHGDPHGRGPYKKVLRVLGISVPLTANDPEVDAVTDQIAEAVTTMRESCALDVIDRNQGDEATLEEVGQAIGVTRERIRQIEARFVRQVRGSRRTRRKLRDE